MLHFAQYYASMRPRFKPPNGTVLFLRLFPNSQEDGPPGFVAEKKSSAIINLFDHVLLN